MDKFKNNQGVFYLQALFFETSIPPRDNAIYTLKEKDMILEDGSVLLSLKRLYLEMEDTTEYEFATEHLGGWRHWQKLLSTKWFQEEVQEWRTELELKLKARSLRHIRDKAEDPDAKENFSANKYLIDKDWVNDGTKRGTKAGRPSKESIKLEASKMIKDNSEVDEDHKRIIAFTQK
jgi:hypothetical protein